MLIGDGLVLRPWTATDLDAMVEVFDDPDVAYRTPLAAPFDHFAAREYLLQALTADRVQWAITTDGRQPLGEVRLTPANRSISYVVAAEHRGRGLAGRALRLITAYGHDSLALPCVQLEIEPDNHPSQAVARSAGFVRSDAPRLTVPGPRRTFSLDIWTHRR